MNSSDERAENEKYKLFINSQLRENENLFCALRREKQLDYLFPKLKRDVNAGSSSLLDLCCGYGRLIYFMQDEFPSLRIHGIDYLEELIKKGKEQFKSNPKISFEIGNAFDLSQSHKKSFDITIIHKTASWLPYYETIIAEAIKATKKKIYVTSLFWDGDIDFITKVYKNASSNTGDNFSYLNTYSLPKFASYCLSQGAKDVSSENMHIDVDLNKTNDINALQTFTLPIREGGRLEFTGPLQLNWKLVEISL